MYSIVVILSSYSFIYLCLVGPSEKVGEVNGRTHWKFFLVLTFYFVEPTVSKAAPDQGVGVAFWIVESPSVSYMCSNK